MSFFFVAAQAVYQHGTSFSSLHKEIANSASALFWFANFFFFLDDIFLFFFVAAKAVYQHGTSFSNL